MTDRIKRMIAAILDKKYRALRQDIPSSEIQIFTEKLEISGKGDIDRAADRLSWMLSMEKPLILEDEKILFTRTIKEIPELFTQKEWEEIRKDHYIHERGKVCNISPNYAQTISVGLEARRKEAADRLENEKDGRKKSFLGAVISSVDAVLELTERYADEAEKIGNKEAADILRSVPRYGAKTFREALQSFRILHFCLWSGFNYHNTVGRFDQYMYPYLKADLDSGLLNEEDAFELLEEFFLSFNKDSDLYVGMQQGDNGQSMVLGGIDESGNDVYSILSDMCLKASFELKLIDPKINLRVSKNTDLSRYDLATTLTKQGLGFPQYSNDDAVIPGLVKKGYALKDARNYVVAACWEFIIPGVGMDIPNIGAVSFPGVVDKVMRKSLKSAAGFDSFMKAVKTEFQAQVDEEVKPFKNVYMEPSPFMSILMEGCIESAKDVSEGLKYNNYGLHGTGVSNAADSLAAIKKFVFDNKNVEPDELIKSLDADFEGYGELRAKLRFEAPKMGDDDDYVDSIAEELLSFFADAMECKLNDRGGIYRAGTGSAMYYVWHSNQLGATPDGRRREEFLSANYAPSLNVKTKGPVSVIRSFSKADLSGVMNGGPLTIELHDSVFRGEESIRKVSMLVKSFVDRGGHQVQVNTLNKETLLDAQKNPENYGGLIVRVWGWSGYFVELDEVYQNQIIQRIELKV